MDALDRLRSSPFHPLAIGFLSFAVTVTLILTQPAAGIA